MIQIADYKLKEYEVMSDNEKKEYTLKEFIELVNLQPTTVYFLLRDGVIVAEERDNELFFTDKEVEAVHAHLKKRAKEKIYAETGRLHELYKK